MNWMEEALTKCHDLCWEGEFYSRRMEGGK